MTEPPPHNAEDDDEHQRRRTNLLLLLVAIALVVAGVWIVNMLVDMRRIQDCVASGRRNCAPISVDGRQTY